MKRSVPTPAELPPPVREGLSRLIADATPGPFGRKSLRQLVADHLAVFGALQRLGGHWPAIVTLLEDCGIVDDDHPLSEDVLRATYSRAKRAARNDRHKVKQRETSRHTMKRNEAKQAEAIPVDTRGIGQVRNAPQRSEAKRDEAKPAARRQTTPSGMRPGVVMPAAPTADQSHRDLFDESAKTANGVFRRAALTLHPLKTR